MENMDKIVYICTPPDSLFHLTLCQNVLCYYQTIEANMKYKYCLIIIGLKLMQKDQICTKNNDEKRIWWNTTNFVHIVHMTPLNLPFHLTLCQNVMSFHQTIDANMKFR
jgi:hypothetical protein